MFLPSTRSRLSLCSYTQPAPWPRWRHILVSLPILKWEGDMLISWYLTCTCLHVTYDHAMASRPPNSLWSMWLWSSSKISPPKKNPPNRSPKARKCLPNRTQSRKPPLAIRILIHWPVWLPFPGVKQQKIISRERVLFLSPCAVRTKLLLNLTYRPLEHTISTSAGNGTW